MDQPRRSSARQAEVSARARHAHSRARRKPARRSQPSGAGEQHRPVIVVGYDATPGSRAALAFAVRRARPYGSVVAVHAVAPARGYLGSPYYERSVERAHRIGRTMLEPMTAAGVETALLEGRPAEVLARVAAQREASEIVVGSRRAQRRGARLGSRVVRKLVALAGRPVVIVPAPAAEPADAAADA
jgi:nucleotide-binding universal stress UspA family protein